MTLFTIFYALLFLLVLCALISDWPTKDGRW
jgi:hypothetical protein